MSSSGFSVHTDAAGTARLTKAMLLYEASGSDGGHATVHEIAYVEGKPVILAGKAARPREALSLLRKLARTKPLGFLPQELLYHDGLSMIWWVPPAVRRIVFKPGALRDEEVSAEVPHPGLVFKANGRAWGVWALDGTAYPTPDTPLFRAPYLNVSDSGAICPGSVELPKQLRPDELPLWNDAFFTSRFTHANTKERLIDYDGSILAFWRAMVDGAFADGFPTRLLVPTAHKLSALAGTSLRR